MSVGGEDDTLAGSHPTITGASSDIPELVANRYKIVRWLGGGGMGRVYEAVDNELGERVALKVLRVGLSADALERFRREVRLTRRINHKNVARMFDIGEHGGDRFLTMELVDGKSLTHELGAPMPWPRLQAIARQICDGLHAAHELGIVHRDLKPDNILVETATDRAVITDFGIARSLDDMGVTQDGAVVGTPRYMSPEQLSGKPIDTRSDVFSLGVMLYELASGTRPWSGDNAIAIAVAQMTQPANPLTFSSLPAGFISLVARCLELDPARRPASVSDLIDTLSDDTKIEANPEPRTVRARPSAAQVPTVVTHASTLAVLPLACAPGDEYLADGLHEDLTDILSTTPSLRVRPAGIVRSQVAPDPREVGKKLDVDHVVAGSLRRTATAIRISARLISVADGFQIWARRIDCTESEVLSTSDSLAQEIAAALSTRASSQTRPTDPRSVDLYLRARSEIRRFWGGHIQSAADMLDQAYLLSPASAPIAGARALATVQAWVLQADPNLFARARAAMEQGLSTGHPEAFLASASFKLNNGDPIHAMRDLATALVRAPMLSQAHEMAGKVLVEIGAVSEARHHFDTAIALDPTRAPVLTMELARIDALEGWWDRADRAVAALQRDPDRSIVQLGSIFQSRFACWRGDRNAMLAAAELFAPRMGATASRLVDYITDAVKVGKVEEGIFTDFVAQFGGEGKPVRGQLMGLQLLAEMSMIYNREETAIELLEEAERKHFMDVVILEKCVLFDRVRSSLRFQRLRDRVAQRAARVLTEFRATAG
jgi:serine/threonine protein kinase